MARGTCQDLRQPTLTVADVLLSRQVNGEWIASGALEGWTGRRLTMLN